MVKVPMARVTSTRASRIGLPPSSAIRHVLEVFLQQPGRRGENLGALMGRHFGHHLAEGLLSLPDGGVDSLFVGLSDGGDRLPVVRALHLGELG
jgi:hypothetical protein